MFKVLSLIGFMALFLIASCGNSGSNGKSGPDAGKFRGLNTLEMNGAVIYQTDCLTNTEEGEVTYMKARLEIEMTGADTADFAMKSVVFTENCGIALIENQFIGNGTFSKNNTLFKTTLVDVLLRSLHDEITDYLNNEGLCNLYDWETGVLKNINSCYDEDLDADIYLDAKNNGAELTIYMCKADAPLSSKCEKTTFKRL